MVRKFPCVVLRHFGIRVIAIVQQWSKLRVVRRDMNTSRQRIIILNLSLEGFGQWCGWRWGASAKTDRGLKYCMPRVWHAVACPLYYYVQLGVSNFNTCLQTLPSFKPESFIIISCLRVVLEHMEVLEGKGQWSQLSGVAPLIKYTVFNNNVTIALVSASHCISTDLLIVVFISCS
jgi:hypothetical protein